MRRTEPGRVLIWLATSENVAPQAGIYATDQGGTLGEPVGSGGAQTVQLGPKLFVHLISARPRNGAFPTDRLLAYDLELRAAGDSGESGDTTSDSPIAYRPFSLPTFFIRQTISKLNFAHGSCRLLHGKGEDAFLSLDEVMATTAEDPEHRPGALFLTGDQIYADDVAGPVIVHLRRLANALMGDADARSVPGVADLTSIPVYGRMELARRACLTSPKAWNHLFSFGEFAAIYLMAWNPEMWPASLAPVGRVPMTEGLTKGLMARGKYRSEARDLERARAALPAVRRVLANIPTYMIFDDHDGTDDWNLTMGWRDRVRASPVGRRVISNALAAFWAFQGWGNDPDSFDRSFVESLSAHLQGRQDGTSFDDLLWDFHKWSFYAPTEPPVMVLDTRTQRDYDSEEGAARLLGKDGRNRTIELARAAGLQPQSPLIFVSPVPVFGLELQERRQKALAGKLGPYEIDFEAWHSDLHGLIDFMELLTEELELPTCLLVSGDIHYGCNAQALFAIRGKELPIVQIVSSGCKHSGVVSKAMLHMLDRLVHEEHKRLGWHRPPRAGRLSWLHRRLITGAANSDEWDDDAPVFLSPRWLDKLEISESPDYAEYRRYVRAENSSAKLIPENNIGLVSVRGDRVVHRLLARSKGRTHEHEVHMKLGWASPEARRLTDATRGAALR